MPTDDRRLIEDYIPIEAISAEARREKSIRKGHISTLHLWWARRPLVAARAAVVQACRHILEVHAGCSLFYREFERLGLRYIESHTNLVLVVIGPLGG